MHPDLCDLVFDSMNHIVEFQEYTDLDDPVIEVVQLLQFPFYILDQFTVSYKMNSLDVYVHVVKI